MGIYVIGDEGGDEGMRERYERVLGDVKGFIIYLRDSTKEIKRIKISKMDTSSDLEGTRLDLLEAQSNLNTRESEMGKFHPE